METVNKADLIQYRPAKSQDRNFILSTWLKGLRHGNDFFELIPSDIYYKFYSNFLEQLLKSDQTSIVIACLRDDNDVILGYSVGKPSVKAIHFVYVKAAWRNIGIARSLVPNDTEVVTHVTKSGKGILSKHSSLKFNPFLA